MDLRCIFFCFRKEFKYDAIVNLRKNDTYDNFKYIVEKMFEIKDVRKQFSNLYRKRIVEDDFYMIDE